MKTSTLPNNQFASCHFSYWWNGEQDRINEARSFAELARIALTILHRFPEHGAHMISGPITTGGTRDRETNLLTFQAVIAMLKARGLPIFSQIPFEGRMAHLAREWQENHGWHDYCNSILSDFYGPVLQSGLVKTMHFIYGWRDSTGATWEWRQCELLGIDRFELTPEESVRALQHFA